MANMAYCRFQNTLKDMTDCLDALYENKYPQSGTELKAMREMLNCCHDLTATIEDTLTIIDKENKT